MEIKDDAKLVEGTGRLAHMCGGTQIRDLLACSIVSQPTALWRARSVVNTDHKRTDFEDVKWIEVILVGSSSKILGW
jgi:hypothetical protein